MNKDTQIIRYASKGKSRGKVTAFITRFEFIDFFSIYKLVTITSIIMQVQTELCLCFRKIHTNFFTGASKLPLIPKVLPSLKIKGSCLRSV